MLEFIIPYLTLDQLFIVVTGPVSIWLVNDERVSYRKWACIFALAGQPAWFYAAWIAGQWGIFAVDFMYLYGWWKGFKIHWLSVDR